MMKKWRFFTSWHILTYSGYIIAAIALWNVYTLQNSMKRFKPHGRHATSDKVSVSSMLKETAVSDYDYKNNTNQDVEPYIETTVETTLIKTTTISSTTSKPESRSPNNDLANKETSKIPDQSIKTVSKSDPRLPKFLIIGVMKCGTSATRAFLDWHPDLNMAKQEAYFFNNDYKFKTLGYDWYLNLFKNTTRDSVINYEKSPTYYKSVRAQERIKAMNSTIKIVNIVCDNVRRTLSRYLHIESNVAIKKFPKERLTAIGGTLDGFTSKLRKTIKRFQSFLDEVKRKEGGGTMDGLIDALLRRLNQRERPFGISAKKTKDPLELILSDGFYAVFHRKWQQFFKDEQMIVIDGNQYLTEPWKPLRQLQRFVGISEYINEGNFVVPESGLPCFREDKNKAPDCLRSSKGRTAHVRFPDDVTMMLREFYRPFDEFMARKILHRKLFDWNFGMD